jgi:hypothetical protein
MVCSEKRYKGARCHRLRAFTAALASLITRFTFSITATLTVAEKVVWNPPETTGLIDFLIEHRLEGDGVNFKSSTFNAAAAAIAPFWTVGPAKTGKMWKTKWSGVCLLVFSFNPPSINGDIYSQINLTYNSIETYRNQSGVSWDNECGAGIDKLSASVWAEYMAIKVSNLWLGFVCVLTLFLYSHMLACTLSAMLVVGFVLS